MLCFWNGLKQWLLILILCPLPSSRWNTAWSRTHIINYAKTRDTYAAYRRTKAADKPAFRTAHEADLLLHEAAKRAFDAQGVKKLPTVKVLQAEYTELLAKKKDAYEDYKRLRKENQELQAVKSNVDTLLRIEEEQQEKKLEQHR